MGRHRFEKEFAEKLRDRELEATPGSWEKLQARLETSEEKKSRFPVKWIGIAASIAAAVLIYSLAFNHQDVPQETEIVNSASEGEVESINPQEETKVAFEEAIPVKTEEKTTVFEDRKSEETTLKPKKESTAVALATESQEPSRSREVIQLAELKSIPKEEISRGLEEVIAAVASEENNGDAVSDAELEELLRKAANQIHMEKNAVAGTPIDANSLLYEVEREIEKSFRDKVFEVLKDSYFKTKTAVANRNF
ncbi:hypothetical protein [Salinimicrobium sp. GXAS 041]|uniref:hypothetical protein n=1 Tax=Salinimicrobium sp. GXAS 041 TaxID=3400806 RepID=UPI003C73BFEE